MNRQRLNRPSLKITRQLSGGSEADGFAFEVWNPFTGRYQPSGSIDDAIRRVEELATLICQMWVQRHPKQDLLADVPDVDRTDDLRWAEFRINATRIPSYDTRRFDQTGWMRAASLAQATEVTCHKVGYRPPAPHVS